MNYDDIGNNDYMRYAVNMASNVKFYKDDLESFLYDIIQLVISMVPSLVAEAMRKGQFEVSFDAVAFRRSVEDALKF